MRKWCPRYLLHWAVILNRAEVRKNIIIIRLLRSGQNTGDLSWWEKHMRYDWAQYRHFMQEQEVERQAWQDSILLQPTLEAIK